MPPQKNGCRLLDPARRIQSPDRMTPSPSSAQKIALYAGLSYLAFVIYGSLVPLEFRDRSWDDALQAFSRIPFLHLGIGSRADWIANILLYMPLTFIWSGIAGVVAGTGFDALERSHFFRRI